MSHNSSRTPNQTPTPPKAKSQHSHHVSQRTALSLLCTISMMTQASQNYLPAFDGPRWTRLKRGKRFREHYCRRSRLVALPVNSFGMLLCERELLDHLDMSSQQWDYVQHRMVDDALLPQSVTESIEYALDSALRISERPDVDRYIKLIEDVLCLLRQISKAQNSLDVAEAITVFVKLRISGSLTATASKHLLLGALDLFFRPEVQSGYDFSRIKLVLEKYKEVKHSEIAERVHCFMLYVLGYSVFDSIGMNITSEKLRAMTDAAKDRAAWKSCDFGYLVLENIVFLCEKGYQSYVMGSLQPLLHSEKTHDEWMKRCDKMTLWSSNLANPEALGFTIFEYQSELADIIDQGESIVKLASIDGAKAKYAYQKTLLTMKMYQASVITKNSASKDRLQPFGVLIAGGSSVMKSQFSKMLFSHYGKVHGLPVQTEYRYVKNFLDKFWPGFQSSKWCIHLDDVAFEKPSAVNGIALSVLEFLQIINSTAYVTNQAELADKGKIPVRARLVTASTNVIDLNAHAYFENTLAPRRRFPLVVKLEVKDIYAKDGMIDGSKVPKVTDGYHNVWKISTYKTVAHIDRSRKDDTVPKQDAELKFVASYEDIDDFMADFSKMSIAFYQNQLKAEADDEMFSSFTICPVCYRRKCNCLTTQADEVEVNDAASEASYTTSDAQSVVQDNDDISALNAAAIGDRSTLRSILARMVARPEGELPPVSEEAFQFETHNCADDAFVTVVANDPEDSQRWYVRVGTNPTLLTAHQNDLFRDGYGRVYWCRGMETRRQLSAFDRGEVAVSNETLNRTANEHFSVVRSRRSWWHPVWWMSLWAEWSLSFLVNYRLGRKMAAWILRIRVIRYFTFSLFVKFACRKTHLLAKLVSARVCTTVKRHKRLIQLAGVASVMLAGGLMMKKISDMAEANNKGPVVITNEEFDEMKKKKKMTSDQVLKLSRDASSQRHKAKLLQLAIKLEAEEEIERLEQLDKDEVEPQVGFYKPTPMDTEYENLWNDHDAKTVHFDVDDMSSSWAGMTWENIHAKLKWNTVILKIRERGLIMDKVQTTRALCLKSRIYVFNKHAWRDGAIIEMIQDNGTGVSANLKFHTNSIRHEFVPGTDLVMIEVLHGPVRKSVMGLIPHTVFMGRAAGEYLIRHEDSIERLATSNVSYQGAVPFIGQAEPVPVYFSRPSRPTENGECGSPLIARVKGAVMLLGIHGAGNAAHAAAVAFDRAILEKTMAKFVFATVNTGEPQLKMGHYEQVIGPLHHKSHTHFEEGSAVVVGCDPGFRHKSSSKVEPTILKQSLESRGIYVDREAPNLRSWKPYSLGLKDLLHTSQLVDIERLSQAAEMYTQEVLAGLPKGFGTNLHFYDIDTAVNGADGVAYVDALNKNTSAGAPANCSKRLFLKRRDGSNRWDITAEMQEAVDKINNQYERGERAYPVFTAHLKDQAIPKAKVEAEKVRVFSGGPMAWTIAVRQRLLWFIRLSQNYRLLFEAGAGTVAQSTEWGAIYEYLTKHGAERMVAGDFAKFDKKMSAAFILHAYKIIIDIGRAGGMAESELNQIWCVAEDTAFAFTNYNGDLLMFLGSNPSGHPLTVTVNSLVNSMYMRYVFLGARPEGCTLAFKEVVALYTYGDDNIMGVKPGCDWFNHTVIVEKLSEIGVVYTMADKTSASVPFVHIDETSFLKRKWRWDEDADAMLCPLEEESIHASLMVGIIGKNDTPGGHAIATMMGALNEWFFHGKDKFEHYLKMYNEIVAEKKLENWLPHDGRGLRTWEDRVASFRRASARYELVATQRATTEIQG